MHRLFGFEICFLAAFVSLAKYIDGDKERLRQLGLHHKQFW